MPGFIGFPELIVLGIVLLLIFGPKRLPEMGRSMGHGLREFKDSISGNGESAGEPHEPAAEQAEAKLVAAERETVAAARERDVA